MPSLHTRVWLRRIALVFTVACCGACESGTRTIQITNETSKPIRMIVAPPMSFSWVDMRPHGVLFATTIAPGATWSDKQATRTERIRANVYNPYWLLRFRFPELDAPWTEMGIRPEDSCQITLTGDPLRLLVYSQRPNVEVFKADQLVHDVPWMQDGVP